MSFEWPVLLALLLAVPAMAALYAWLQRRRQRMLASYGKAGFVQRAGAQAAGLRRHIPAILFLIGLALAIIALARPSAVLNLPRVEGTVILAFDISQSMAAEDIAPNRMEAAKIAAREFVSRTPPTVRVGVVAFSDNGFSIQPPTRDQGKILTAIERLEPERGTSLGNGILTSLTTIAQSFSGEQTSFYSNRDPEPTPVPTPVPEGFFLPASVILLTDGENTGPPEPLAAAQIASERGIKVHTIGIGSPNGAPLSVDGFTVQTRLDEQALQAIAGTTGGGYFNAQDAEQLRGIYADLSTQFVVRPEETEITAIFAGLGLLFLLIGGLMSLGWFGRLP